MLSHHQGRPKSQPPIKLNEVCSNYKRNLEGATLTTSSSNNNNNSRTINTDDEHHWSKLSERYERTRDHFKGSARSLATLEELEDLPLVATTTTMDVEEPLSISSPSSSSPDSLASSSLSLSSTVSSTSTVLAATRQELLLTTSCKEGERDHDSSPASSTSSSSGVSSTQTTGGALAVNDDNNDDDEVAHCLRDLVESVSQDSERAETGRAVVEERAHELTLLGQDAHMVKELEVDFLYEPSEFGRAQVVKLARRHIFQALKQANRSGRRESTWRVNLLAYELGVQHQVQLALISWFQNVQGPQRSGALLSDDNKDTGGVGGTEQTVERYERETCVLACEIIDCLVEHELVIWLVERRRRTDPIISIGSGGADYLLDGDEKIALINDERRCLAGDGKPIRRLVQRRERAALRELAEGGNLIGIESANLHSIDAIIWLCSSELEASRARDQWQLLSTATTHDRLPAIGCHQDETPTTDANNNVTVAFDQQAAGLSLGRPIDESDGKRLEDKLAVSSSQLELDASEPDEEDDERQKESLRLPSNLRKCRNSIFVHNASRLRSPAVEGTKRRLAALVAGEATTATLRLYERAASNCDLRACQPSPSGFGADHRQRKSFLGVTRAEAADQVEVGTLKRAESCSLVSAPQPQRQQLQSQSSQVGAPTVKPRMSILKSKQATTNAATKQQQAAAFAANEQQQKAAASNRRLSVSSIKLNAATATPNCPLAKAKPKSILKNGSHERQVRSTSTGENEPSRLERSVLSASKLKRLAGGGNSNQPIDELQQAVANASAITNLSGSHNKRESNARGGEIIRADRQAPLESSVARQRRKSIAHFDCTTAAATKRVGDKLDSGPEECEKLIVSPAEDEATFVSSGSVAREQAFERLRQRASCYDITRLMSKSSSIQSQLARGRSTATAASAATTSDARQRKPAELLAQSTSQPSQKVGGSTGELRSNKRMSIVSVPTSETRQERALTASELSEATVRARGGAVTIQSGGQRQWVQMDDKISDKAAAGRRAATQQQDKVIEVQSGSKGPKSGIAVLPLPADKLEARKGIARRTDEEDETVPTGPAETKASKPASDDQEEKNKTGGLSKFNLLRQSFNQKTISSMLKFSSRASLRIRTSSKAAVVAVAAAKKQEEDGEEVNNEDGDEDNEAEREARVQATPPQPSATKSTRGPRKLATELELSKLPSAKVAPRQHKVEQQIAAIDSATLMLYNRHMQRQQQQQLLMQQQQQRQQQQQQQYAFQWQQQMLIQQRHHQHQQLAYMANHYHVTTAHHQQQQQQFMAPPLAPVAMGGANFAAMYAAAAAASMPPLPLAHAAHQPLGMLTHQQQAVVPQQQAQQSQAQSFVSSAGTLLRKSIMKSSSSSSSKKYQPSRIATYQPAVHQHHQSSQLIPLSVNHHSSVNIVYADNYASQQQIPANRPQPSRGSSLGASMRKTVKSMLNSRSSSSSSTALALTQHESNKANEPKRQLKSALKQASRSASALVLNSEGSDGDGSSTTVESSSSADREKQQHAYSKPSSILKKSGDLEKTASMLSLNSDLSSCSSSDDSNFKRATSTRCSRRPATSQSGDNKPLGARAARASARPCKSVTFSTKLTSIL